MTTLDLAGAAKLLKMHPQTVLRRARAGTLPAAKPGKCWVFIEADLLEWLRSHYAEPRHVSQGREKTLWHSIEGRTRPGGGLNSPHPTDEKYAAALELKTGDKPRSTKTA